MTSALDIAVRYQDAWTAGNFDTAAALLADDFVFDGPIQQHDSADEFVASLQRFAQRLVPGWKPIAVFGDESQCLLLYDLLTAEGLRIRSADRFIAEHGQLTSEILVFDTHPMRPPSQPGRLIHDTVAVLEQQTPNE